MAKLLKNNPIIQVTGVIHTVYVQRAEPQHTAVVLFPHTVGLLQLQHWHTVGLPQLHPKQHHTVTSLAHNGYTLSPALTAWFRRFSGLLHHLETNFRAWFLDKKYIPLLSSMHLPHPLFGSLHSHIGLLHYFSLVFPCQFLKEVLLNCTLQESIGTPVW